VRSCRLPNEGRVLRQSGSIVSGHSPGAMPLVAGCTYWPARRLARPRLLIVVADTADGADGLFGARADPDHPASSSTFTTELNVNAHDPQERLRTTQAAGEARGFFGQTAAPLERPESARSAPARRRSEALPVHVLRFAIICRIQAATGSASIKSSIAVLRFITKVLPVAIAPRGSNGEDALVDTLRLSRSALSGVATTLRPGHLRHRRLGVRGYSRIG
jgi:hypothetical protein